MSTPRTVYSGPYGHAYLMLPPAPTPNPTGATGATLAPGFGFPAPRIPAPTTWNDAMQAALRETQPQPSPATPQPATPPLDDDAYKLLNRGGSLKLQQMADFLAANAPKDQYGTVGGPTNTVNTNSPFQGPYPIATAPVLSVPPGFNGGFVPATQPLQPGQTNAPQGAQSVYGFFVPVGYVYGNGQAIPGFGTGQPVGGSVQRVSIDYGDGGGYGPLYGISPNGPIGGGAFGYGPTGYGSTNPALLFNPMQGALLNQVL